MELESELLGIPETDYSVEIKLSTKKFLDLTSNLLIFDSDVKFICNEDNIKLVAESQTNGEMCVNFSIDDLSEYSIEEDKVIELKYNLGHLYKKCLTNKLTDEIKLYINSDTPMKLEYCFKDSSNIEVCYYMAPKLDDEETE